MALTENQIIQAIKEGVAQSCACGHKDHVIRLFDRVEAMGAGNVEKGIESLAKSIVMMTRIRHLGERIGGEIAVWVARALFFFLLLLLGVGIKNYIEKGGP